jgi:hypothetical protein
MTSAAPRIGAALTALIATTTVFGFCPAVDAETLQYVFRPQAVTTYDFVIEQQSEFTLSGDAASLSSTLKGVLTVEVDRVLPSGVAELTVSFDRFDAQLRNGDEALSGRSFEWVIDYVRANWALSPTGETVAFISGSSSKSESGLANLLRDAVLRSFPVLPDKAVSVGDSWPSTPPEDNARYRATTRLVSVSGDPKVASLAVDGQFTLQEQKAPMHGGGTGHGEARIELATGALVNATWQAVYTSTAASGAQKMKLTVSVVRRDRP